MVKDKLHKNEARDKYVVIELENYQDVPYATIQKFEDKFMCRQYRVPIAKLIILPNYQHTVPGSLEDKPSDSKLYPTVYSLVLKGKTQVKEQFNKSVPTHSWDYDQYLESVMEDFTTYDIYDDPGPLSDSSDDSQLEPADSNFSDSNFINKNLHSKQDKVT